VPQARTVCPRLPGAAQVADDAGERLLLGGTQHQTRGVLCDGGLVVIA
jgi:hypothetical protein